MSICNISLCISDDLQPVWLCALCALGSASPVTVYGDDDVQSFDSRSPSPLRCSSPYPIDYSHPPSPQPTYPVSKTPDVTSDTGSQSQLPSFQSSPPDYRQLQPDPIASPTICSHKTSDVTSDASTSFQLSPPDYRQLQPDPIAPPTICSPSLHSADLESTWSYSNSPDIKISRSPPQQPLHQITPPSPVHHQVLSWSYSFDDSPAMPPQQSGDMSSASTARPSQIADPVSMDTSMDTSSSASDSSPPTTFRVVHGASQRGKTLIFDSLGFSYNYKRTISQGNVWQCTRRKTGKQCGAELLQQGDLIVTRPSVHRCTNN